MDVATSLKLADDRGPMFLVLFVTFFWVSGLILAVYDIHHFNATSYGKQAWNYTSPNATSPAARSLRGPLTLSGTSVDLISPDFGPEADDELSRYLMSEGVKTKDELILLSQEDLDIALGTSELHMGSKIALRKLIQNLTLGNVTV